MTHPQPIPLPAPDADAADRGWIVCEDYCDEIATTEPIEDDGFVNAALVHDVIAALLARGHVHIAAAQPPSAADPEVAVTNVTAQSFRWYRYERVASEVLEEVFRARKQHAPMRGAHEGYAVILEELDELWAEVKDRRSDLGAMRREAIQVAAMAIAFVVEVAAQPPSAADPETDHVC
jgi:hypothetical protein